MMVKSQKNINFIIDKNNQISIQSFDDIPMTNLTPFEEAIVLISYNGLPFKITSYSVYEILLDLRILLNQIDQKVLLDDSINEDIGFLWNEKLNGRTDLKYCIQEGTKFWVGSKYSFLSSSPQDPQSIDTWLYTNQNNTIIFEITPTYPWTFGKKPKTKKEKTEYVTYEEFAKSYKPLVKVELSQETAQQWLKQVQEMIDIVETNYRKMKERGEV